MTDATRNPRDSAARANGGTAAPSPAPGPVATATADVAWPMPPRQAWFAVAVLTLANVSGFVDRQILSLLVEPMKRDLAITDTQVSLLMGLGFVVFYSVLGLPIGRLVDRARRPLIVAVGIALWSCLTAVTGLARSFAQMFAARIGVGVGEATLGPAAVSLIGDAFPPRRLGTAMSTYQMGSFLGSGVAYALGAWVVGALDRPGTVTVPLAGAVYPWQTVFFAVGLPGLLVALLALTMRDPPRGATATDPAVPATAPQAPPVPIREVLAYMRRHARTLGTLSFAFAFALAVNFGIGAWNATYFIRTHGWTAQQAGTLQGVLTFTIGPLGVLLGGWLSDRWARRGLLDAPLRVGMLAAAGMLLFAGSYPAMPTATASGALLAVVNVFAAMPWGAASAAVAQALPSRMRGTGAAVYQVIVNLVSGALGPTAVAVLTDRVFGDPLALRWSLVACTVVGMSCTLLLLAVARPAFRRTVGALGGDGADGARAAGQRR